MSRNRRIRVSKRADESIAILAGGWRVSILNPLNTHEGNLIGFVPPNWYYPGLFCKLTDHSLGRVLPIGCACPAAWRGRRFGAVMLAVQRRTVAVRGAAASFGSDSIALLVSRCRIVGHAEARRFASSPCGHDGEQRVCP
jgi:hypothetical protein